MTSIIEKLYLCLFNSVNLANGAYFVISTSSSYNHVLIFDEQNFSVILAFSERTQWAASPFEGAQDCLLLGGGGGGVCPGDK